MYEISKSVYYVRYMKSNIKSLCEKGGC